VARREPNMVSSARPISVVETPSAARRSLSIWTSRRGALGS
jgi:hypothetical protein